MYSLLALFFFIFLIICYLLFFFFSSRRRHTRCLSDWSSDVCSSDLLTWNGITGANRFLDLENPSIGIPKSRNRFAPVIPFQVSAPFFARDFFSVFEDRKSVV